MSFKKDINFGQKRYTDKPELLKLVPTNGDQTLLVVVVDYLVYVY